MPFMRSIVTTIRSFIPLFALARVIVGGAYTGAALKYSMSIASDTPVSIGGPHHVSVARGAMATEEILMSAHLQSLWSLHIDNPSGCGAVQVSETVGPVCALLIIAVHRNRSDHDCEDGGRWEGRK